MEDLNAMPGALGTWFYRQSCASFKKQNKQQPKFAQALRPQHAPDQNHDSFPRILLWSPPLGWHPCPPGQARNMVSFIGDSSLPCSLPLVSPCPVSPPSPSLCPQDHLQGQAALWTPPHLTCSSPYSLLPRPALSPTLYFLNLCPRH